MNELSGVLEYLEENILSTVLSFTQVRNEIGLAPRISLAQSKPLGPRFYTIYLIKHTSSHNLLLTRVRRISLEL